MLLGWYYHLLGPTYVGCVTSSGTHVLIMYANGALIYVLTTYYLLLTHNNGALTGTHGWITWSGCPGCLVGGRILIYAIIRPILGPIISGLVLGVCNHLYICTLMVP